MRKVRAFHVVPVVADSLALSVYVFVWRDSVSRQRLIQLLRHRRVDKKVFLWLTRREVIHLLQITGCVTVMLPLRKLHSVQLRRARRPEMIIAKLPPTLAARRVRVTPDHVLRRIITLNRRQLEELIRAVDNVRPPEKRVVVFENAIQIRTESAAPH